MSRHEPIQEMEELVLDVIPDNVIQWEAAGLDQHPVVEVEGVEEVRLTQKISNMPQLKFVCLTGLHMTLTILQDDQTNVLSQEIMF